MNGPPTTLLKPKSLNTVLSQAITGGISCILLLSKQGSLVAHAGGPNNDAVTIAALSSTIWRNYQRYGNSALHEDRLKSAIIQSQGANLILKEVSVVLLCICADQHVPLGMLRCKANSLAEFLGEPLDKIFAS